MDDSQHEFYYWILWALIPQSHRLITPISMYFLWAPIPIPQYPTGTRPACRGGGGGGVGGSGVSAKLYTPLESRKKSIKSILQAFGRNFLIYSKTLLLWVQII